MSYKNIFTRFQRYLRRLNGCTIVYDCSPYREMTDKIRALGPAYERASDADLKNIAVTLKLTFRAF
jgi:hypothetical protein